jgi:Zn-dependent protease
MQIGNFGPELIALGIIWYIVFLFSTVCHEAAHALAAKLGGDPTAAHGGQVSLNPFPHMQREPIGLLVVPLVTFFLNQGRWMIGWASAPYDPDWAARYPRRAAWMALAGPAANFTLMLLAAAGIRIGMTLGHFRAPAEPEFSRITEAIHPEAMGFAATFLSILFLLNLVLGTFNLLPVPPLDGNSAITLLMSRRAALRFQDWTQESGFGWAGLLVAWVVYGRAFGYIFRLALNLLYPEAHYVPKG